MATVRDQVPPDEWPRLEALVVEQFLHRCFGITGRRELVEAPWGPAAVTAARSYAQAVLQQREAILSQVAQRVLTADNLPTVSAAAELEGEALFLDVWRGAVRRHRHAVATACETVYLAACLPPERYHAIVQQALARLAAAIPINRPEEPETRNRPR